MELSRPRRKTSEPMVMIVVTEMVVFTEEEGGMSPKRKMGRRAARFFQNSREC